MTQNADFEKLVKHKLIDLGKNQAWLIEQVKEKTGLYCDSSYISKIFTENRNPAKIKTAICDILGITEA